MFDHILRQGDRVRMEMDHEARGWGCKGVADGTLGTVIGRFRATGIIENRYPASHFREPGIYELDSVPLVVWDEYPDGVDPLDPEYARTQSTDIKPADTFYKEYHARYKEMWPVNLPNGRPNHDFCIIKEGYKLDNMVRTGDLPESDFWELDIVSWEGQRWRITRVEYNRWGSDGVKGAGRTCYPMEGIDENGDYDRSGTRTVEPRELVLIERGNVWREAHGAPLVFRSIQHEATYATAMARSTSVRNPAHGLYMWTLDETLQALKDGIADGFINGTMMFSDKQRISVTRFDDRDLGERVRAETMKGFQIAA